MFGKGSMEEARAMQASFTKAQQPRKGNKNRKKGGSSGARRGVSQDQPRRMVQRRVGRDGDVAGGYRQEPPRMTPNRNYTFGRDDSAFDDSEYDPQYEASTRVEYGARSTDGHAPRTAGPAPTPQPAWGELLATPNSPISQPALIPQVRQSTYTKPTPTAPSPQPHNTGPAARPSSDVNQDTSPKRPAFYEEEIESHVKRLRGNGFGERFQEQESPFSPTNWNPRPTNVPAQRGVSNHRFTKSYLDGEMYQPSPESNGQYGGPQAKDDDIVMSDVGAQPERRGLAASRWNPANQRAGSDAEAERVENVAPKRREAAPERREATTPTGPIVSSGMLSGPGLGDSRWAH
ncbi:hypothetical protein F4779DRAFT_635900 [Xylariaceae sp. FL0662B]|nr:hypothetical protein F4779DRAFT_635900 [Xylariaceae sp. FL0662B]